MGKINPQLRNLLTSLVEYEAIKTNAARAKQVKRLADKMISIAKHNDFNAKREVKKYLYKETAMKKLFSSIVPRFGSRTGGYVRMTKIGYRKGDAVPLALLEIIDRPVFSKKERKQKKEEKNKKQKLMQGKEPEQK